MTDCHCFFFIDACGAEVVRPWPVFTDLAPRWKSVRSVFGYSSACVPSILSGLYPEQHQHWSFFTHQSGTGLKVPRWLSLLPASVRDRGRVRSALSRWVAKANGITGYFQLYQMPIDHLNSYGHCEPRDIFSPGGLNNGSTFIDRLAETKVSGWVADWHRPEAENWAGMRQAATNPTSRFLFMYAASLDAWLHDHTRNDRSLEGQLRTIRNNIESVLAAARANHDNVTFHVFSDHGMCSINRHLDPFPALERTRLRMHHDYHCVVDSTMIRIWCDDDKNRQCIRTAVESLPGMKHLDKAYLAKEHCDFPDQRFGQDIFLAEPGLLLVPSHMGRTPLLGMHGYDCDHPDSDASYLTNHPTAAPADIVAFNRIMLDAIESIQAG